jgi:hypothetical protein
MGSQTVRASSPGLPRRRWRRTRPWRAPDRARNAAESVGTKRGRGAVAGEGSVEEAERGRRAVGARGTGGGRRGRRRGGASALQTSAARTRSAGSCGGKRRGTSSSGSSISGGAGVLGAAAGARVWSAAAEAAGMECRFFFTNRRIFTARER